MVAQSDEEQPRTKPGDHKVGQDLGALSVDELETRIELLQTEIARLQAAKQAKSSQLVAASQFFKR